jgi:hypothetical protein
MENYQIPLENNLAKLKSNSYWNSQKIHTSHFKFVNVSNQSLTGENLFMHLIWEIKKKKITKIYLS